MAALIEAISNTLPTPLKAPAKLAIATVTHEERSKKRINLMVLEQLTTEQRASNLAIDNHYHNSLVIKP
jgi:hypothetical protein